MPVDRQRIDGAAVGADAVHVADMVAQVHVVVELLRETVAERQDDAVNAIQQRRSEERVVDEVVAGGIDAP